MKTKSEPITDKQMSSIHIYYREVARVLNESGFDIQRAIDLGAIRISIGFTEESVKEIFGKAVIQSLFPEKFADPCKSMHPRLTTVQTQLTYETLNAALAERFGISIGWPEKPKDE